MLDESFRRSLQAVANGDGSQLYAIHMADELRDVAAALSHRYQFSECVKQYGRERVALCVAATMQEQYGYKAPQLWWARQVLAVWTNRVHRSISEAQINIHPATLADNSYSLRKCTSVGGQAYG